VRQSLGGSDQGTHCEPAGNPSLADITHPWRPPNSSSKRGKSGVMPSVRAQTFPQQSRQGLPGPCQPPLRFLLIKFNVFIFKDLENPNTF